MAKDLVKVTRPRVSVTSGNESVKDRLRRQVQANIEAAKNGEALMLCLDASGSMSDPFVFKDYAGPTRFSAMKQAAMLLVDKSDEYGCTLGVVTYCGMASEISGLTRDFAELKRQITRMGQGSITEMGEGLWMCANALEKSSFLNRRIILLCDGQETARMRSAISVVRDRIIPLQIRVDCIAIGDKVDVSLLKNIAAMTGGVFLHPGTPQELQTDFLKLESRARLLLTSGGT
jgi:Mg-chelatase subunit ChlD